MKMLYVIAYDISNNKRRTKLHKILSSYGQWTQFSLFECFLSPTQLTRLKLRILDVIDAEVDSVRLYPLCEACQGKVQTHGSAAPEEPEAFLL